MEQSYRYLAPSTLSVADGITDLSFATSSGIDAHPVFFDGFLNHPEQSAQALLLIAKVARTRFYLPPNMIAAILRAADPVVTSDGERLRFESFSVCGGVYARLDVLPAGLDTPPSGTGTTNVDVNDPMRIALASVGPRIPLHLRVGQDVQVTTAAHQVTEVRVPLPERWLRGFAEVQVAASRAVQSFSVTVAEARRFLRSLPGRTGAGAPPLWVVPAGAGLRLSSRQVPGAVGLGGAERLKNMEPLLRFATGVTVHAEPDGSGACFWVLELVDARLTLGLSPGTSRGFSGEGGVLLDLADERTQEDADLVSVLLAYEPRIDVDALAAGSGLEPARVLRALTRLAASGQVGFDVVDGAYFHRELPYDQDGLLKAHPRLRDARQLVADGAVSLDGDVAVVRGKDEDRVVRGLRCTCPWYAKHGTGRGPCKHVIAAAIVRAGT